MPLAVAAAIEDAQVPATPRPVLVVPRRETSDDASLPDAIAVVRPGTIEAAVPPTRSRYGFLACSLALHLAVLLALLVRSEQVTPGADGHELDAVGVEVVSVAVLESLQRNAAPQSGAAAAPLDMQDGEAAPAQPPEAVAAPSAPPPEPERAKALEHPDPDPPVEDVPVIAAAPVVAAAPVAAPDHHDEPPPKEQKQDAQPEAAAAPAPPPGASQSAAQAREAGVEGANVATASPGDIARFALAVRQALGRARPRHPGARGRVQVRFALDDAGTVRIAEILHSSGNRRADDAALGSIRAASFPRPPAGLAPEQLVYVVPFDFR